jgi:hypothetical protein
LKLAVAALLALSACGPDRDIYVFASASDLQFRVTECDCERAFYELPVGSCWDHRDCPCMFGGGCMPGFTSTGTTLRFSGCNTVAEVPLPTTFPTFTLSEDNGARVVVAGGSAESVWVSRASDDDGAICRQDRTYSVTFMNSNDTVRIEGATVEHVTDIGIVHVTPITIVDGASE